MPCNALRNLPPCVPYQSIRNFQRIGFNDRIDVQSTLSTAAIR
jgi:hypothetical protein